MRLIVSSLCAGLALAGCAASSPPPSSSNPSPEVSELSTRVATPVPLPKAAVDEVPSTPKSPLLPAAFFADGAEAFTAWRCTPAQDLISAFPEHRLRLWSAQGSYELERAVVASGARYVKGDLSFWDKGNEALVESDNGRLECQQDIGRDTSTREEHPGTIFHAQGNEPGWTLDLDRDAPRLTLVTDYGERTLKVPYRVANVVNGQQASMTLHSRESEHAVKVRMEARACFDDMSGKPYPVQVTVQLGTQRLRGCGQGIEKAR